MNDRLMNYGSMGGLMVGGVIDGEMDGCIRSRLDRGASR